MSKVILLMVDRRHQSMALSMMIEKESGRIEGNEFGTLWRRTVHRGGGVRYHVIRMSGFMHGSINHCLAVDMSIRSQDPRDLHHQQSALVVFLPM